MARRGLVAADILWTASLVGVAYAASRADGAPFLGALSAAGYAAGSFICHQRPERSFHLWGAQLPVCARCTGIYLGAAAAGITPRLRRVSRPGVLISAALFPAAASLVFEWTTGVTPSNVVRAVTGVIAGAAVMAVLRGELRGE